MISQEDVSLYKFSFTDKKDVYVVWLEDGTTRGLNDSLPVEDVTLKDIHAQDVLEIPLKGSDESRRSFQNTNRGCEIEVSPTPVIILSL
jgi:hypothetical protein